MKLTNKQVNSVRWNTGALLCSLKDNSQIIQEWARDITLGFCTLPPTVHPTRQEMLLEYFLVMNEVLNETPS